MWKKSREWKMLFDYVKAAKWYELPMLRQQCIQMIKMIDERRGKRNDRGRINKQTRRTLDSIPTNQRRKQRTHPK